MRGGVGKAGLIAAPPRKRYTRAVQTAFTMGPRGHRRWLVPVGLITFVIADGVHVLFLFGMRLRPLARESGTPRPALLWMTRAREAGRDAQSLTRARLPERLQRVAPPDLPSARRVAGALLMRLAPTRVPVNILAPTTVPITREAVAGETRGGPGRRQWRLTPVSGTGLLQLDSWAPESWVAGERDYRPRQAAVLELTVVAPGGYRNVAVLQSSGDPAFDQAACDQVRRLAVRADETGSTPDRAETAVYRRARIAATVEERRGP